HGRLVQGAATAEAEESPTRSEQRDRRHGLRADRWVIAEGGRHAARPETGSLRFCGGGAKPGEREWCMPAGVAPRMEVVADGNAVVAKLLREHGVVEESLGVELLRRRFPAER